jgi:tryptophan 2,3-dioxygenase
MTQKVEAQALDLAAAIGIEIEALLSEERQGAFIGSHQVRAIEEIQGRISAALAAPAVAPVASEAAWRVTLRPENHSISDKLEFTFTQKDEYAAFVKAHRAKQSVWAITDICEYQASTAESACSVALIAIPGEEQ